MIDKTNDVTCNWTCTFDMPWPHPKLSPNAREHWTTVSRLKRGYRARCRTIGQAAGVQVLAGSKNRVCVHLTFFPPDKRARDADNMLAAMKSGLDGLADAMGVDDSKWRVSFEVAEESVKGGVVFVQVKEEVK